MSVDGHIFNKILGREEYSNKYDDSESAEKQFKILYSRYADYGEGDVNRACVLEDSREVFDFEDLKYRIENNQKFLKVREEDVMDFSKDHQDLTGLDIFFIEDENGEIVYPPKSKIKTPDSEEPTLRIWVSPVNYKSVKEQVANVRKQLEAIFRVEIDEFSFYLGDESYFLDTEPEDMCTIKVDDVSDFREIVSNNINLPDYYDGVNHLVDMNYYTINFPLKLEKFKHSYTSLEEYLSAFFALYTGNPGFYLKKISEATILHVPSGKMLYIEDYGDEIGLGGSMGEEFSEIKWINECPVVPE